VRVNSGREKLKADRTRFAVAPARLLMVTTPVSVPSGAKRALKGRLAGCG
jgi:hypothetical protein